MGILDRFLDAIKLNDVDEYDDDILDEDLGDEDEDFLDDDLDERPKKKIFDRFTKKKSSEEEDDFDDFDEKPSKAASQMSDQPKTAPSKPSVKQPRQPSTSPKITPMRSSRKSAQTQNVEVCVIKPTSMENTREIADTLLDNSTVILNLEGIDVELAQRIIDFASGACYSLNGTLQKISSYIFVLGPYNVDITGDLQNVIGEALPSVRAGY